MLHIYPRLIVALLLNHDTAPHRIVTDAAEGRAEDFECSGPGRGEPEVGLETWHRIHLGPELGDIKVVHDIDGAEQYLDRLPERQVQLAASDHDIVLPVGIVRIQTQGIVGTDVAWIGRAEPAVPSREAKAPLPLLTHYLKLRCLLRDRDVLVPHDQSRH